MTSCLCCVVGRETKGTKKEEGGLGKVSHVFRFQVRCSIFILLLIVLKHIKQYIYIVFVLFIDYMMNSGRHKSVFELRFSDFVNVVLWCLCYRPSAVKFVIFLYINVSWLSL